MTEHPLSKRIKRHVTGRIREFFAVVSPGFEKLCFDELTSLPLSVRSAIVVSGGVEFRGRIHDCYLTNLNLRTATRILMRIGMFKATNFCQLERKLAELPWELFLPFVPGAEAGNKTEAYADFLPQISVTARHSRLYHKAAITERFQKSISKRFAQTGLLFNFEANSEFTKNLSFCSQQIFVRVLEDRFTVSIDSSGDILYKRGIKTHGGNAPIRETIAAAALKLAGYNCNEPLVDPMCGSGTFSLEAAMMATNTPPGWLRNFAFMGWPSFRPRRWSYIKQESEKNFIQIDTPLIFASDKDKSACDILQKRIERNDLSGIINVSCSDFFDVSPSKLTKQTGLVVLNPPYGLRIGTKQESDHLFHAVCRKLKQEYKGWKIALIAPDAHLVKKVPFKLTGHRFSHGGLELTLLVGNIT
ncbi:THUMP domain-containing class I SAM-dependent RNA methyltransferase [Desulfonema magnum]|uniref:SAM-dependent RNA methylase n=1 Tax=Desulfonema magnum TaxID=45655 RepID=A0A975GR21_9BACT|nr:hypothetical protein [Desulfonema magnum]QTA90462.1 SAM-dependent RNA methylase [Desulfonema magnum]